MSKRKKEKNSKHVEVGAKYSVLADSYKDKKPEKKNDSARKDEEKETTIIVVMSISLDCR